MGVLVFFLIVGLLIVLGVFVSVNLYSQGVLNSEHIKRIRRRRFIKPTPNGPVIEETVEEIIDEEEPVEEVPGL